MKKLIIAFGLSLLASIAQATNHYVCDCQAGAAGTCVAGSAGGTDTAASPKQLVSQLTLAVSDTVSFCLGGAWSGHASITGPGGTSASTMLPWTAPFVWNTYSSPNFSSSASPRITFSGTGFDFNQVSYNEVTGLTLIGSAVANSKGIIMTAAAGMYSHGNNISNFALGIAPSDGNNSFRTSDFISVGDTIHNNVNIGSEGCADRMLIENDTFDSNGSTTTLDHQIYVAGLGTQCNDVVIRGNTLTNNMKYAGAACAAVVIVGHGWITNMTVEDNTITETGTNTAECYGISFGGPPGSTSPPSPPNNQDFTNLVIRRNRITMSSLASQAIQVTSAPNAVISDNAIEHTNAVSDSGFYCTVLDTNTPRPSFNDAYGGNAKVINNSCKIVLSTASPALSTTACWVFGTNGTGGDVVSNNACTLANGGSATLRVFQLQGRNRSTSFANISNNVGINLSGTTAWDEVNSTPAAAGESGSSIADPNWATFPAVNIGSVLIDAANVTYATRIVYGRYYASGTRDIGADERSKSIQAPLGIGIGRLK